MRRPIRLTCLLWFIVVTTLVLTACSPTYNWRETHGEKIPFTVLLPAKPSTFSRNIDLNGLPVDMSMTAAEIDGITFAVGTAELSDVAKTAQALESMRLALLNNINATPATTALPARSDNSLPALDVSATGVVRDQTYTLMARLIAKDKRIYQVLIMATGKTIPAEQADTFFSSFKPAS